MGWMGVTMVVSGFLWHIWAGQSRYRDSGLPAQRARAFSDELPIATVCPRSPLLVASVAKSFGESTKPPHCETWVDLYNVTTSRQQTFVGDIECLPKSKSENPTEFRKRESTAVRQIETFVL